MDNFLDILFAKFCLGCGQEGALLCEDCKSLLDILDHSYCLCEHDPVRIFGEKGKCRKCNNKTLSGLLFALPFSQSALTKKLVHSFKYKPYVKSLAKPLASILVEHFIKSGRNTNQFWENSVLIPVPLHTKKLKERGYNQSEELAKELSKTIKIPVVSNFLIKTKNTPPQMELEKEQRQQNLLSAFSINQNLVKSGLTKFKKAFLVDDVYTTGCTMGQCAQVLKSAGFHEIWGIALARESWPR